MFGCIFVWVIIILYVYIHCMYSVIIFSQLSSELNNDKMGVRGGDTFQYFE